MTEFSISTDTLEESLKDLEIKKLQYNNFKKGNETLYDFEKMKNNDSLNQSKIDIKFEKAGKEEENSEQKKEADRREDFTLILDEDEFDKKENDEMIQKNTQNNQNLMEHKTKKQIQLNANISNKEYKGGLTSVSSCAL